MTTMTVATTQVYQLFIRATHEQVWEAITKPEFTTRYFFASRVELSDGRRRAHGPNGELWGDSAILEEDPPRRLVHEWAGLYDPELAAGAQPTWSPDGKRIAFTNVSRGRSAIYVVASDGGNSRKLTRQSRFTEYDPAWAPA